MKKVLIILLSLFVLFTAASCSGDDNPIIDIINKEIQIIKDVDSAVDAYKYSSIEECLADTSQTETYCYLGNQENCFRYIVYVEDDIIKMQIVAGDMPFVITHVGILESDTCSLNIGAYPWIDYSNIIQEVVFGISDQDFELNFQLDRFCESMPLLERAEFKNCKLSANCTLSMNNMFYCCNSLKEVIFYQCSFLGTVSMKNMFNGCIELKRCDLRAFDDCQKIKCKDLFANTDSVMNVISNNQNIIESYEENIDSYEKSGQINNSIYYYNIRYSDLSEVEYIDMADNEFDPFQYREQNELKWCVYADSDNIIHLKISNGDVLPANDSGNEYRIIEANSYNYDNVLQGWKKYGNLISDAVIQQDNSIGNFQCSMCGWFKEMSVLNYVSFNGVHVAQEFYATEMFFCCYNLLEIDLNNCYFDCVYGMDNMLNSCYSLYTIRVDSIETFNGIQYIGEIFIDFDPNIVIYNKEGEDITHEFYHLYYRDLGYDPYSNGWYIQDNIYSNINQVVYKDFYIDAQGNRLIAYPENLDLFWYIIKYNDEVYLIINSECDVWPKFSDCQLIDCGSECFYMNTNNWKKYSNLITYIEVNGIENKEYGCSIDGWFENMTSVKEIHFNNLCLFHQSSMDSTFENCSSLVEVTFSNCDFSGVNSIIRCYADCVSLVSIKNNNENESSLNFGKYYELFDEEAFSNANLLTSENIDDNVLKKVYIKSTNN